MHLNDFVFAEKKWICLESMCLKFFVNNFFFIWFFNCKKFERKVFFVFENVLNCFASEVVKTFTYCCIWNYSFKKYIRSVLILMSFFKFALNYQYKYLLIKYSKLVCVSYTSAYILTFFNPVSNYKLPKNILFTLRRKVSAAVKHVIFKRNK